MGLENLRRWQWAIVGVAVGVGFAYFWNPSDPTRLGRKSSQNNFEQYLNRAEADGRRWIKGVVVYPPAPADDAGPSGLVQIVTFDSLTATRDPKAPKTYVDQWFAASLPYRPVVDAPPSAGDEMTVQSYLKHIHSIHPETSSRYAWYADPKLAYPAFAALGLIVIGGIWPTIIYALTGGPPKKAKKETYDVDRFAQGEEAAVQSRVVPADADAKLRELEESMEKSLQGFGKENSTQAAAEQEAKIRQLDGAASDVPVVEPKEAPKSDADYRGEFYPTARAKKNE